MRPLSYATRVASAAVCGALLLPTVGGCASTPPTPADAVSMTGTVVDRAVTVQVPALEWPEPNVAVALPSTQPAPFMPVRATRSTVGAVTSYGSVARITSVTVEPGQHVEAGDPVALLDDRMFAAAVTASRLAAKTAHADVRLLESRLDDIAGKRTDLNDARTEVDRAISTLETTRKDLAAKLATIRAAAAQLPTGQPPQAMPATGSAPPAAAMAAQAAKMRALVRELETALARIDAGLAKARAGRAKLARGRATLEDAESTLEGVRGVARLAAAAADTGVELARARRAAAVLRAPLSGTVLEAGLAGGALWPGAPVARIEPDGPSEVEAWVTPAEAAGLALRREAEVRADWTDEAFRARCTFVAPFSAYPPGTFASSEVHLMRAVRVRFTLTSTTARLPSGTPVDLVVPGR